MISSLHVTTRVAEYIEWATANIATAISVVWATSMQSIDMDGVTQFMSWFVSIISVTGMAWYNIERAIKMRRDRNKPDGDGE